MRYVYPFDITDCDEAGEGFLVTFPDVPEAITGGFTRAQALSSAEDCITTALGGYVQMGWSLPTPSTPAVGQELAAVPPLAAAKLSIYSAMQQQGVTRTDLAQKLNITDRTVEKLLIPDRHSPWSQITRALELLGRKLVVEDRAA